MDTKNLLREAIEAFKAGQRQYARELFLELVEVEPTNDLAWCWLSGLLDGRDEQIKALENALALASGGKDVEDRLHLLGEPDVGPELARFREALRAIEAGERNRGRAILEGILADNKDHERAWMALSDLAKDKEEQVAALEHVLRINPNNFKARERLTTTQHILYQDYLLLGREYQRKGELARAVEAYQSAERHASTGSFRSAAQQRWQMIQFQDQFRKEKSSSPNLTLIRLAAGPPIIYAMLILIHSGLAPQQIEPAFWLGGILVIFGSLLRAASAHTPYHPIWTAIWGEKGLSNRQARSFLQNLGTLLLLVPFFYWLVVVISQLIESDGLF
jgi:tetratricopeptide (TPR) repeat protein